jgi:PST family polysaccharide transporter
MIRHNKSNCKNLQFSAATDEPGRDGLFDTGHLKYDLKRISVRSGVFAMTAQMSKSCLQILTTVILARLLNPEDFGLVAMVAAVTGFVLLFKDMGLSLATVQKTEVNHAQISTLFWVNTGCGIALAGLTTMLGPLLAWFYGEPRLTLLTAGLAGAFVFGGLTVQHEALLKRQMRFGTLAIIGIASTSIGVITAVVFALGGAGYWALVAMHLAIAVSTAAGAWIFCLWRPGLPTRLSGVKSMLTLGGHVTGFNIVNYMARNLDKILIGRYGGPVLLGFYDRAYQVVLLPIVSVRTPLLNVAVPALSRLKDEPARYKKYYTKLILLISMVTMPVMVFCFVCSESMISLVLGDRWIQVNDVFKVLALVGFIEPVAGTRGSVLMSLGQGRRCLWWGLLNGLVIGTAFAIGVKWGALGVAAGYAIGVYALLLPSLLYCFRFSPLSVPSFFRAIWRSAAASFIMGLAILCGLSLMPQQSHIVKILVSTVVGIAVYLVTWVLLPNGKKWLYELHSYFLLLFTTRRIELPEDGGRKTSE